MASGTIPHTGVLYGIGGMFMSEAVNSAEVTALASNDNLNSAKFTATGKYSCSSASIGQTLTNVPENNKLFLMLVYNPHNSDTGQLGTANYRYRIRILITFNGSIYIQQCHCEGNTTILYESWQKVTTSAV